MIISSFILDAMFPVAAPMYWSNTWSGAMLVVSALAGLAGCGLPLMLLSGPRCRRMSRMIEVPPHQLYEEVRVTPTRTALVVADMQNDFVRPGGSLCVPDAEATIPAIRGLLDLARAHGMHVVYSQDTRRDGIAGLGRRHAGDLRDTAAG